MSTTFLIIFYEKVPTNIARTFSGDGEIRTLDPLLARQVLSQLSYAPICHMLIKKQAFLLVLLASIATSKLHTVGLSILTLHIFLE